MKINSKGNKVYVGTDKEYTDIQKAIDFSSPGNTIVISDGFYNSIVINKPGISLEAEEDNDEVVILAEKGDAILVNIDSQSYFMIKNIKVCHSGTKAEFSFNKMMKHFFNKKEVQLESTNLVTENFAKTYNGSNLVVSLLRILRGQVICEDCVFSYKILSKSIETITPAIVINQDCSATITRCEIVGHSTYNTIGIIVFKGNLIMDDSKLYLNLGGGVSALLGRVKRK